MTKTNNIKHIETCDMYFITKREIKGGLETNFAGLIFVKLVIYLDTHLYIYNSFQQKLYWSSHVNQDLSIKATR